MTVREAVTNVLFLGDNETIEIVWEDEPREIDFRDELMLAAFGDCLIDKIFWVDRGFQFRLKTSTSRLLKAGDTA